MADWQLTEEAQRQALAQLVNAISHLDVTQVWGVGRTSSSDGQRFEMRRKVLQRTYSHRIRDYALEFYSFVADNYAPFYSVSIECTDRDAAYVLDGVLYNEGNLVLEEHYIDTHGYTEINFAAFAMLGRRFAPRIRGLHKQRIYRIDPNKDYGSLTPLLSRYDCAIHIDWICEQWDRMGQFYASLENGHATASTALKRLAPHSVRIYNDWPAGGRPAELHLYSTGGHGFGMRTQNLPSDRWIELFAHCLEVQGLLQK